MYSSRWIRASAAAFTGIGLTLTLTGLTFAQTTVSLTKNTVKSSGITMQLTSQQPQIITGPHGTITLTPLGDGQWQAMWTWHGLNRPDGLPVALWGWKGTQSGTPLSANLGPGPNESPPKQSGDTVTIDFTQPHSYPAHPEVVQFSTFFGALGAGPTSPVGQLPEVPWAAGLPLILVAPFAVRALKHRMA